jgi:hypothetical protein
MLHLEMYTSLEKGTYCELVSVISAPFLTFGVRKIPIELGVRAER